MTSMLAQGAPPAGVWSPLAILAEGALTPGRAKTAAGVLRYGQDPVAAVIDSTRAPGDTGRHLGVGAGIPVVATIEEAQALGARALLIGTAPRGGRLPDAWRGMILEALARGMSVANGLHTLLGEEEPFREAARRGAAAIWDARRAPAGLEIAAGRRGPDGATVVLTVGSDCHTGKMTVAIELHRAATERGERSFFVPTGQTGIFIAHCGVCVDRVPSDFVAGVTEAMVREAAARHRWVWVEGQGTIHHPAYSAVSMGLLHGAGADLLVLCHQPGRERIDGFDAAIPPLGELVRRHQEAASWVRPARVAAVALDTHELEDAAAKAAIRSAREESGLPAFDPVRYGTPAMLAALEESR